MLLADPSVIKDIDSFAESELGLSAVTLMARAGHAVAEAVRASLSKGAGIIVLAGKGNNGGDGYAAACELLSDYRVRIVDVFSAGQRTEAGRTFLEQARKHGIEIICPDSVLSISDMLRASDCVIDAILGTGMCGEYPAVARELAAVLREMDSYKIAVDLPLGVNASDGSVSADAVYEADATVALSFVKTGLVSYPAKKYVGKLYFDNLGLPIEPIMSRFNFDSQLVDRDLARSLMPLREDNSSKGSFGKLLLVTGSEQFRGAAALALESALRGGAGLVGQLGEDELCRHLCALFPEAIYHTVNETEIPSAAMSLAERYSAVLVGSGSGKRELILETVLRLLSTDGCPLVLDADAINLLSELDDKGHSALTDSRRTVVLTPHPLELARLAGLTVDEVQGNRISVSRSLALKTGAIVVLKGASTVITDGKRVYINSSGSSALAKAGSGDALAGLLSSLVASGVEPMRAAALAVYVHGAAGDVLATQFSHLGVTPSDLPRMMARVLADLEN